MFYTSVYDSNFPNLVRLPLLLVMFCRVFFSFPPRGHEPPPILRGHLNPHPCLYAVASQSQAVPNTRTPLITQSINSCSFPLRPLRTAPSRFFNTICFGNHQQLIRMNVPTHQKVQGCPNVFTSNYLEGLVVGSHLMIVCALPRLCEARLRGVRYRVRSSAPDEGSTFYTVGPRLPRLSPFRS